MATPVTTNDLHQLIIKKGKFTKLGKKQTIQTTEVQTSINLLTAGFVKRYMIKNDGSLSADLIYGPGDVFSLTLVFRVLFSKEILDSPEIYYYETLGPAELYSFNTSQLAKEVEVNPLLYKYILNEAGKRMRSATQGLENKAMKNSYGKVAHILAYYCRRFGKQQGNHHTILPELTHQDLADILGLTRETVSVSMMRLRKEGLIKVGRRITVLDLDKLVAEAFS